MTLVGQAGQVAVLAVIAVLAFFPLALAFGRDSRPHDTRDNKRWL